MYASDYFCSECKSGILKAWNMKIFLEVHVLEILALVFCGKGKCPCKKNCTGRLSFYKTAAVDFSAQCKYAGNSCHFGKISYAQSFVTVQKVGPEFGNVNVITVTVKDCKIFCQSFSCKRKTNFWSVHEYLFFCPAVYGHADISIKRIFFKEGS